MLPPRCKTLNEQQLLLRFHFLIILVKGFLEHNHRTRAWYVMVPIQPYVLFCELIESLKYPLVWSIKQLTFSEYHV